MENKEAIFSFKLEEIGKIFAEIMCAFEMKDYHFEELEIGATKRFVVMINNEEANYYRTSVYDNHPNLSELQRKRLAFEFDPRLVVYTDNDNKKLDSDKITISINLDKKMYEYDYSFNNFPYLKEFIEFIVKNKKGDLTISKLNKLKLEFIKSNLVIIQNNLLKEIDKEEAALEIRRSDINKRMKVLRSTYLQK